eukprot:scaffold90675_cov65-Phaeocystis_antarctica.AAC.4
MTHVSEACKHWGRGISSCVRSYQLYKVHGNSRAWCVILNTTRPLYTGEKGGGDTADPLKGPPDVPQPHNHPGDRSGSSSARGLHAALTYFL